MKYVSTFQLFEEIKQKTHLGAGADHIVFPKETDPTRVYKIGPYKLISVWEPMFRKYPDIFPIVYKTGPVTNSKEYYLNNDYEDQENPYYVELEKLDVTKAKMELARFQKMLGPHAHLSRVFYRILEGQERPEDYEEYFERAYTFFLEWLDFIKRVDAIVYKIKGKHVDFNPGNFGYDQDGNRKCLDI